MNIGKLVRQKMKELSADCSGEYLDNAGKHFSLAVCDSGYTVSYGGEKKKEISISKEQGHKLASASRKLEAEKTEE